MEAWPEWMSINSTYVSGDFFKYFTGVVTFLRTASLTCR